MVMPRPEGRAKKIANQVIPALKEKTPIFKDAYTDETSKVELMGALSALPPFSLNDNQDDLNAVQV